METNFDEGISDEVLRGSFLALKQLQTKGKQVGKLKKSPVQEAVVGPRSRLYEKFKAMQGLEPGALPPPFCSLLMYRTYKQLFDEKHRKIRYTDETKPPHPFFSPHVAVLAEEFRTLSDEGHSAAHQEIQEGLELEGLVTKYNYNMCPPAELEDVKRLQRAPVVKPLKSRPQGPDEPTELSQEFVASLQRVLVDYDDE